MVNKSLRLSQEEFIKRSISAHGNNYDYSKSLYVNYETKVLIICNTCGIEFKQNPDDHYGGSGCPICKNAKIGSTRARRTGEQFVSKAKKIHGDKYDYSLVKYVSAHDKVSIVCNRCCQCFDQDATGHLVGHGCPRCCVRRVPYSTQEFIDKARSIHGDRYGYSKTVYFNAKEKVTITCSRHGDFFQKTNHHISGHGCMKCSHEDKGHVMTDARILGLEKARRSIGSGEKKQRITTEEFINSARKVHGKRYNYEKAVYQTSKDKVTIICNKHGEFTQEASSHARGTGCPRCSSSKGEMSIAKCLDAIGITYEQEKKFPECKDKRPLQFDFYFIHRNVKFLVEYHGVHHSRPVKFFENRSKIKHEWYKRHDQIKRDFARRYNFVLIEIWHTVENVSEYLVSQINLHLNSSLPLCAYPTQLKLLD